MNRVLTIAASVAAFAISLPAVGQANQDATAVQAGDYTVESTHTQVQFSVNHFGINDFYGTCPSSKHLAQIWRGGNGEQASSGVCF